MNKYKKEIYALCKFCGHYGYTNKIEGGNWNNRRWRYCVNCGALVVGRINFVIIIIIAAPVIYVLWRLLKI